VQVKVKMVHKQTERNKFHKIHHGVELRKKIDLSFYDIFVIGSKDYIEMKVLKILDFAKL
jgi:hypothetical protein